VVGACLGALVISMSWSEPARAEPPGAPAASATVKQLYDEGFGAAKRGQWVQAYPLLARAWETERRWQVARLLGQAEVELGKYRDAAEHLTFFLRETRDNAQVGAGERASTEQLLVRAGAHVGALTIVVEPLGAEVLVDGVRVGTAPLADPVYVQPGKRSVEVRHQGYLHAGDSYRVDAGQTARVELRMARRVIPAPRGWRGVDTGVVVGGALATLAAAGVGAGFAVWSNENARDSRTYQVCPDPCMLDEYRTKAARFGDLQSQKTLHAHVSFWSFVGAGALAVGTVTYAIAAPRVNNPIKLTGLVGPGGATAALSVGW
jgi:hypothetical protein